MFVNNEGRIRLNSEKLFERALAQSPETLSCHEELKIRLKDVLNSFERRLEDLPEQNRKAVECLLYQELAELVFDFRLSIETRLAREEIRRARTHSDKLTVVEDFRSIMADVEMLHGK